MGSCTTMCHRKVLLRPLPLPRFKKVSRYRTLLSVTTLLVHSGHASETSGRSVYNQISLGVMRMLRALKHSINVGSRGTTTKQIPSPQNMVFWYLAFYRDPTSRPCPPDIGTFQLELVDLVADCYLHSDIPLRPALAYQWTAG